MNTILEDALRACLESLEHIEREMLPEGERFAPWSHPALSMRMARKALGELDAQDKQAAPSNEEARDE